MAVIAGIDEAGLGPVLGPLVVSVSALHVPDELAEKSMWSLLSPTVARRPSRRRPVIAIGDSKKLYSRQGKAGLLHLERGVLAMLATRACTPSALSELLAAVAPQAAEPARHYPWYANLSLALPRRIGATEAILAGNALAAAMNRRGMRLLAVGSEVLFAGEFNRLVAATRSKSATLFDVTSRLLMGLWRRGGDEPLRVYVDRHGGRRRYLPALQRVFDGCHFKVLAEDETLSAYRLTAGARSAEVHFCVDGEQRQLPVALSSMVSKYVRELFMTLLNGFWCGRVADLAPTAGYYVDGRRFYREIQPAARTLKIDHNLLYRCR